MKKLFLLLIAVLFILPVKADEGMWFLMHIERLNYVDMQKMGLQLTPEEIYSINNHSLKDAIVQFGGGCTAEIISSNGLVLTNHHCGYGQIAGLSTEENDYLTNGFWAKSHAEELKPQSLSVRFFVRMDDVTDRILRLVNDNMTEEMRERVVNQEIAKIEKENNEGGKYTVSVRPFYNGNEYYYFVYQDFKDVRLVGTPPNSIGKFGGDTDNWEWPRHTGDFAIFRVYADKNGNPTEYSEDNVPLQTKYHLPISLKGVEEDDFAMILGYPGRTNRWMPAAGIDQNVNYAYPAWVEASKVAMDAMKKHMDQNQQVKLDYAPKYASIANYWKNRQGMIDALTQHKTADKKREAENQFQEWIVTSFDGDNEKFEQRLRIMDEINAYFELTNEYARSQNYLLMLLRNSRILSNSYRMSPMIMKLIGSDENGSKTSDEELRAVLENVNVYFSKYNSQLEEEMLQELLTLYLMRGNYTGTILPNYLDFNNLKESTVKDFVGEIVEQSVIVNAEKFNEFIKNPQKSDIKNDVLINLAQELYTIYNNKPEEIVEAEEKYQKAFRKMIQGFRDMNPDEKYYPDANSTLRLSYGKVRALPRGNKPNDASENYFTTLKGTVAKYQPGDEEFDMPQKLIDLYNAKDFGSYADKAGHLPINFLTDHDITGGNSGSPVLNGKGELIGIAFDGNIEAMAGDVIFDDQLQRAINVDIRYVLFIIDKFAGATNIIEELTIAE